MNVVFKQLMDDIKQNTENDHQEIPLSVYQERY